MPVEIRVPPLGESLVDAVVGQWLKQEGDAVSRGETVVELETDKVNLDVTAEDDGVICPHRQAGRRYRHGWRNPGHRRCRQRQRGLRARRRSTRSSPAGRGDCSGTISRQWIAASTHSRPTPAPVPAPAPVAADATTIPGAQRAAPAVRRLAEEYHLDLNRLAGSGPGGRITREDVLAASQTSSVNPAAPIAAAPAAAPTAPAAAAVSPAHRPPRHRPMAAKSGSASPAAARRSRPASSRPSRRRRC